MRVRVCGWVYRESLCVGTLSVGVWCRCLCVYICVCCHVFLYLPLYRLPSSVEYSLFLPFLTTSYRPVRTIVKSPTPNITAGHFSLPPIGHNEVLKEKTGLLLGVTTLAVPPPPLPQHRICCTALRTAPSLPMHRICCTALRTAFTRMA